MMDRRRFLQCLGAGLGLGLSGLSPAAPRPVRVAALQMVPRLGNVTANLAQAERLIDEAVRRGAQWIVLPELFTSAVAFHEDMLRAIRPVDGAPAQLLHDKALRHGVTVGGSFLARAGDQVYNRFVLCRPDGSRRYHDKDQPTYWEACYYEGGNDDGVMHTSAGDIGAALCWELIRTRTARRLRGRVRLLLAGSTWWTLPESADADHPYRRANRKMLAEAPARMARLLGVPVIHAAHAGPFRGFDSPELPDVAYDSVYLGGTRICDATGRTLAHCAPREGATVILADIEMPDLPQPTERLPARFWLPEQMPEEWQSAWTRWLTRGADYYAQVTRPYLASGEVPEYLPPYLRD